MSRLALPFDSSYRACQRPRLCRLFTSVLRETCTPWITRCNMRQNNNRSLAQQPWRQRYLLLLHAQRRPTAPNRRHYCCSYENTSRSRKREKENGSEGEFANEIFTPRDRKSRVLLSDGGPLICPRRVYKALPVRLSRTKVESRALLTQPFARPSRHSEWAGYIFDRDRTKEAIRRR